MKDKPARCTIECTDIWNPGSLTDLHRAAYESLARLDTIRPIGVHRDGRTGQTVVKYLSAIPHPWALEALGQLKREWYQLQME